MKRILCTILLCTIWLFAARSQYLVPEVVAGGGGHTDGNNASLSWTVGEIAIETHQSGDVFLTQGFHQPGLITTGVREAFIPGVSVYPNPTTDRVRIDMPDERAGPWFLMLIGPSGQVVLKDMPPGGEGWISLAGLPVAPYLLVIRDEKGKRCHSTKIWKIH